MRIADPRAGRDTLQREALVRPLLAESTATPATPRVHGIRMKQAQRPRKQVLFIHGGGEGGYEADASLAASLERELGAGYNVRYPHMPSDETPDFGWGQRIASELAAIKEETLLVGHSLGASMLLKVLSEHQVSHPIRGIFLLATPFWTGDQEWQKGLVLREDFARTLPKDVPVFLYHNEDDEEIRVSDLAIYEAKLPHATVRRAATGGHQFGDDLGQVARDIKALK
jgi:predicted alpha/beta hydrolase family esterase